MNMIMTIKGGYVMDTIEYFCWQYWKKQWFMCCGVFIVCELRRRVASCVRGREKQHKRHIIVVGLVGERVQFEPIKRESG